MTVCTMWNRQKSTTDVRPKIAYIIAIFFEHIKVLDRKSIQETPSTHHGTTSKLINLQSNAISPNHLQQAVPLPCHLRSP